MTALVFKQEGRSLAAKADVFVQQLQHMQTLIKDAPTEVLAGVMTVMKPLERGMADLLTGTKDEIKARVVQNDDWSADTGPFRLTSNAKSAIFMADDHTVTVQKRESVAEREDALDWLTREKPHLVSQLTETSLAVADVNAVELARAKLDEAVQVATRGRVPLATVQGALSLLNCALTRQTTLSQKAVEKAKTSGALTSQDISNLYRLKASFAIVTGERKADALAETD